MCRYTKAINCVYVYVRAHLCIEVAFYTISYVLICLGCVNNILSALRYMLKTNRT